MYQILGYSDNGCFEAETAPDGLLFMLGEYDGQYDGEEHGIKISVTSPASGYTVKYRTTASGEYNLTENQVKI